MPRSNHRNKKRHKWQNSISLTKHISPKALSRSTPDTEFKRMIINFIKGFRQLKEAINEQFIEFQQHKYLRDVQENTNTHMNEITKKILNLKAEFNKKVETLKRTQAKMKIDFKNSI